MTTFLAMACLLCTITVSMGFTQAVQVEKTKPLKIKDLDKKYQDWLTLVNYIITPTEKDVFLKLTNNLDRDTFINLFWNLRDPSKGTPQNEFQEEHIKRFNYANRYFRGPGPGWRSDRGKMYILLGPPVNTEEILETGVYPVLIWEYYGGPDTGFPTVFRIAFYKRGGAGDYKLYIPAVDGPLSLLQTEIGSVDPADYETIYSKIKEVSPPVAEICLTLVPGESLYNFSPSLHDPVLIGNIYDLPKRKINASYATNFLNLKGMVETTVMTNYINMKTDLVILKNPVVNMNFVHFSLLPDRISVDYSEEKNQYYFNFNLMAVLKQAEEVIFQYTKDFSFYYSQEDLDRKLSNGIIIQDYFPVIEGEYRLYLILQNSVNKEISYYERKISTAAAADLHPKIYGPLVSYQVNPPSPVIFSPYNIMGTVIGIDPQKTFGLKDNLYSFFCVDLGNYREQAQCQLIVESMDETRPYRKIYSLELTEGKKFELFTQTLEKLNYGNYSITASLLGKDRKALDTVENAFVVSPLSTVPHPPFAAKSLKSENQFLFYTMVAQQYENVKNFTKAESFYEEAFRLNPSYPQLLKLYAQLLLNRGKYDKMLEIIENLKNQEKEAFNYFSFKGRALYHKGRYQEAVDSLLEANKIFDSDVGVLNTLGLALVRIDEKEEAIKALSASLKINDSQEDVAGLLRELKGEIKDVPKKK